MTDSFGTGGRLDVGDRSYRIFRTRGFGERLPYSIRVMLENLLRNEDGRTVTAEHIERLAAWDGHPGEDQEVAFRPARILLQDLTGVPVVADLAAMRDAFEGDPDRIRPRIPVELVVDHSVMPDSYGTVDALAHNVDEEYRRNAERYRFLRWGQQALGGLAVVPPGNGICHQVNLEHLARVVFDDGAGHAYPDTVVGADSHTPMVNGLGVLGWGVGGIEAEAAMLGQPISMLVPPVVGFRLSGNLREGATATDLVLTIAEMLRRHGVVGAFVEFFGPGVAGVPAENRATIGNMSPEYGSTVSIFPIDDETLRYLRLTGRTEQQIALVDAYAKEQGLWHDPHATPAYSSVVELDLGTVVPSLSGPSRPQDRVPLDRAKVMFSAVRPGPAEGHGMLDHGSVVIAAITSCTNTSNPSVMVAAGLLARNAVERGLASKPWVKTSMAPGSRVVVGYLDRAGLTPYLDKLGFNVVGFGCTTCFGNSGPLPDAVTAEIRERSLSVCSVLSGNRNFEGRINGDVRLNYLGSPPLVVAYAIAGTMDIDLYTEPLGVDADGTPVHLHDVWPSAAEVSAVIGSAVGSDLFRTAYADVFTGDDRWRALATPTGQRFAWEADSTYVRRPPFFSTADDSPIRGARALAVLGDSVTTDHISPAGAIRTGTPAAEWLIAHGVEPRDFNSYGSRRGNHEVMMRGTFANVRLRNRLARGTEGGFTVHVPSGEVTTIFDAAGRYRAEGVPLLVLAGKEYGTGSSRDWAAKGPVLLGVRAVIAESFERIHRSNLVGMGVLPLQFEDGDSVESLGLTGREAFGVEVAGSHAVVTADDVTFRCRVRIDTPVEAEYYRSGGILPYVLRTLFV